MRKRYIATISFEIDDDAGNVKHVVDLASDRMQECEGNVHVYDADVEEDPNQFGVEQEVL